MSEITVRFPDGSLDTFAEVTELESGWLRCTKDEPSSRMDFPVTVTYYKDAEII